MPREFHSDLDAYFDQQRENALASVVPFVREAGALRDGARVLEIGCGHGGIVQAFAEAGANVTGIDLHGPSIDYARSRLAPAIAAGDVRLLLSDVYDADPVGDLGGPFDLVVMKDTIEHIHDQARLLGRFERLLAPGGAAFFGFPPWRMPFGGHQQICEHRLLMRAPWIHLLPAGAYASLLRRAGEAPGTVDALLEMKETGISIARFERIAAAAGLRVRRRRLYLVNPMYRYRYGLAPRVLPRRLAALRPLRDFATTSAYYLLTRG